MKNDLWREHTSPRIIRVSKWQTALSTLSNHYLRLKCNSADSVHTRNLLRLLPIRSESVAALRQTIAPLNKLHTLHIHSVIQYDFNEYARNSLRHTRHSWLAKKHDRNSSRCYKPLLWLDFLRVIFGRRSNNACSRKYIYRYGWACKEKEKR